MTIYAYTKVTDQCTTYQLNAPDTATELATVDGVTYVHTDDPLPEQQPEQITVSTPALTPELVEAIKAVSPHVKLIASRMIDKIRERYSVDDELFFARIAGGAGLGRYDITPGEQAELDAYQAHVEAVREWGRGQRAALGLVIEEPAT